MHPPAWHRWRRPNYATSQHRFQDWQHNHCCVMPAKASPALPPAGTHPRFSGRIGIGAESPEPQPKLRPLPDERVRVFRAALQCVGYCAELFGILKRNDRACDSFKFKERCQFFVGGDDETLSSRCGSAIQTVLPWGPRLLEQPEEFED